MRRSTEDEGLKSGDIVGQAGIEKIYNAMLMGEDGAKRVVVNSVGREIRTLDEDEPTEGKRAAVDDRLRRAEGDRGRLRRLGFNGAAVILDPANGDVLGFTSRPAYDPNAFAAGIDRATWASLNTDELRPLSDRAIQGTYSPGSTFKMAVATGRARGRGHHAGLQGVLRRRRRLLRPRRSSAGRRAATARSICATRSSSRATCTSTPSATWSASTRSTSGRRCSGSARRAASICRTKCRAWCRRPSGSASGCTRSGTPAKRSRSSIGQGAVSVTPVSMAVYMATLANGGTRVTPHLLKAVDDGSGWKPVPPPAPQSRAQLDPDKLQAIRDGLLMVVNGGGTGGNAQIEGPRRVGQDRNGAGDLEPGQGSAPGKTNKDLRDNGWFVFFAPRDKPEIAGVVFLEHGVHGSNAALDGASHARDVLREEGRAAAAAEADDGDLNRTRRSDDRRVAIVGRRLAMFERRLYYHIDWALLLAILALCGLGVAMIYSTTSDPTRGASHMYVTQLYAIVIGWWRWWSTLTLDYRDVHRQVASDLHRHPGAARLRAVLRRGA